MDIHKLPVTFLVTFVSLPIFFYGMIFFFTSSIHLAWGLFRMAILLFLWPEWIKKGTPVLRHAGELLLFYLMATLPLSLSVAWISGTSMRSLVSSEIFWGLAFLEVALIFRQWGNVVREVYTRSVLLLLGVPVFFYFIYLDIYRRSMDWLLSLGPTGILISQDPGWMNFLPLVYPLPFVFSRWLRD